MYIYIYIYIYINTVPCRAVPCRASQSCYIMSYRSRPPGAGPAPGPRRRAP